MGSMWPEEWLEDLFRAAGISQREVAQHLTRQGYLFDQSRLSRALNGKVKLRRGEQLAMLRELARLGVLRCRADARRVGQGIGAERGQLEALFADAEVFGAVSFCSLHQPVHGGCYVRPPLYGRLIERLIEERGAVGAAAAGVVGLRGAPGAGKTLLVQQVAFDDAVRDRFGVILYGSVRQSGLETLVARWQAELGLPPQVGPGGPVSLRRGIGGRRVLLILDDVGQVEVARQALFWLQGGDVLLVAGIGDVGDALGLSGGNRLALGGWDVDQVQRYLALSGDSSLAEGETLAELNGLLEGLPLAWQIVAGWRRAGQDWARIAAVLREDTRGLVAGHTLLERCFDRAYQSLSEKGQRAVRALGVFAPSSWDAAALGAVLDVSAAPALAAVSELVSAGWVRPSADGAGRLEMHRLLQGYAQAAVEDDAEAAGLAERHARHYARRVEGIRWRQAEVGWPGLVREAWPDLAQVYHAWEQMVAAANPLAVPLFLNVLPLLCAFYQPQRWTAWARETVEVVRRSGCELNGMDAYALYTQLIWGLGDIEERLAYSEQAYWAATEQLPAWNGAYVRCAQARLWTEAGELARAEACLQDAWQEAVVHVEVPKLRPYVLREVGWYCVQTRDRAGCAVVCALLDGESAAALGGGAKGAYDDLMRLETYLLAGRWPEAEGLIRRRLAHDLAVGDVMHQAEVRARLAACLAGQGRNEEAQAEAAQVERMLGDLLPGSVKRSRLWLGEMWLSLGQAERALAEFEQAAALQPEDLVTWWTLEFVARLGVGRALLALGQSARGALERAWAWARERRQPFWEREVLALMGDGSMPKLDVSALRLARGLAAGSEGPLLTLP